MRALRFPEDGLIPVVIQDEPSRQVLTLCYLTRQALTRSLATGLVHVFRRSQGRLMLKGERSGHTQAIRRVLIDCEGQSLVFVVRQRVAGCHAGHFSCYFRQWTSGSLRVVSRKVFDPRAVYQMAPARPRLPVTRDARSH